MTPQEQKEFEKFVENFHAENCYAFEAEHGKLKDCHCPVKDILPFLSQVAQNHERIGRQKEFEDSLKAMATEEHTKYVKQLHYEGAEKMWGVIKLEGKYNGNKKEDDLFYGFNRAVDEMESRAQSYLNSLKK